jgi:hypothetical protein
MAFWGQGMDSNSQDPKRKFKFKIQIGDLGGGIVWYAKSVGKPEMTIESGTEHKFLGHTFKYPGSVKWNDIEATLVDPVSENASRKLLEIVEKAGYVYPNENYIKSDDPRERSFHTISKGKAAAALGPVVIQQIDSENKMLEQWTLHNAFINKVSFGELSYDSEELSEISIGFTYDWATYGDKESGEVFNRKLT